jgi:zinc transport system substrate-binding protein
MRNLIANHLKIKLSAALVSVVFVLWPAHLWANESLRVVTSFYPVYVAALNVTAGVPGVEVSNLASPHIGCLHDYQLTAGDVRRLADADILLVNGAGMEPFLGKVAQQSPKVRVVEVSEGIPLLEGNPHVWVSLEGARRQTDNIAAALAAADPDRADAFRANAAAYNAALTALEEKMRTALAPYAGTPIVTFHEAFPYFARDFGLDLAGVIEREPGAEPSARELADTVKLVRARQVKALFAEPQFPDQSAQVVARETGVRVYSLDPVVTGPSDPAAARGAYLQAMEKNLEVLQEALR